MGIRKNIIGENMRKFRLKKGYTQQQLSDKLETLAIYICRGSVSRIESGEREVTDIEIIGIAEILGVSILDLFHLERQEK